MGAKKNYESITFRPSPEVALKLAKAMKALKLDQSKTVRKALEHGLDLLESQGYDTSKALINAITSKQAAPSETKTQPMGPLKSIQSPHKNQKSNQA